MFYAQPNAPSNASVPPVMPVSGRAMRLVDRIRAVADGSVVSFIPAGGGVGGTDAVFDRYDLRAISAREIDELVDDLIKAGFRDKAFLAMLSKRGEAALAHSRESFARMGYQVSDFDALEKLDLLQLSEDQLNLSQAFGQPAQESEAFRAELIRMVGKRRNRPSLPGAEAFAHEVLYLSPDQRI